MTIEHFHLLLIISLTPVIVILLLGTIYEIKQFHAYKTKKPWYLRPIKLITVSHPFSPITGQLESVYVIRLLPFINLWLLFHVNSVTEHSSYENNYKASKLSRLNIGLLRGSYAPYLLLNKNTR